MGAEFLCSTHEIEKRIKIFVLIRVSWLENIKIFFRGILHAFSRLKSLVDFLFESNEKKIACSSLNLFCSNAHAIVDWIIK